MNNKKMTYREVIEKVGDDFNPKVTIGDGLELSAWCWTDDPEVLDWDACFSISTNWGEGVIGRFDNLHNEMQIPLQQLADQITAKVGGVWTYNAADCTFEQASIN